MHQPMELDFGHVPASPSIKGAVRAGVARLNRYCPDIIGCHVAFSRKPERTDADDAAQIHVRLTLPGAVVDVNHAQDRGEDLESAIHLAFEAMQHRLEDWVTTQHAGPITATSQSC